MTMGKYTCYSWRHCSRHLAPIILCVWTVPSVRSTVVDPSKVFICRLVSKPVWCCIAMHVGINHSFTVRCTSLSPYIFVFCMGHHYTMSWYWQASKLVSLPGICSPAVYTGPMLSLFYGCCTELEHNINFMEAVIRHSQHNIIAGDRYVPVIPGHSGNKLAK